MTLNLHYFLATAALAALILLFRHAFSLRKYPSAPGPKLAAVTSWWYAWQTWKGDFEKYEIEAHRAQGPILRIAPDSYSIDDPEAVNIIYSVGNSMPKSAWYDNWGDPRIPNHNLFSARDRQYHAIMRKKVAKLYSMSSIKSYEPYVDHCIAILSDNFDQFAIRGQQIDLQHWMQCYAFDVIGELTLTLLPFGHRIGFLESGGQDIGGIMHRLDLILRFATLIGISVAFVPLALALYGFPIAGAFEYAQRLMDARKEKRIEPDGVAETFYDKLEKMQEQSPQDYEQYRMAGAMNANINAGSDTTSIALTSIMYYIVKNISVYQKLRKEIFHAIAEGKADDPITFDQAQNLPYLGMVLKEALRMHPSTGLPMWRVVQEPGATISGKFFPAGSIVGINSWVACKNKTIFGADADEFRPERWDPKTVSQEELTQMERYNIPFGVGTRTCIGKNISILEMTKLIPELVRKYDFELLSDDMKYTNYWFVKQKDVMVRIRQRESSEKRPS